MTDGQSTSPLLHPKAIVDIFRHGHAAPAEEATSDFIRLLSPEGKQQAMALKQKLADNPYDIVICSAAPRAQHTAELAMGMNCFNVVWCNGGGRELYCPESQSDFDEIFRLVETVKTNRYGDFLDNDTTGVFARFQNESLTALSKIPGIRTAQRIVIFNHAVMANAIGEALFPQHATILRDIELAPGDGIRISTENCEYLPL